jgi:hypothetical protein
MRKVGLRVMQRDKFYLSKRQKPKDYLAKPNQREEAKRIRAGFSQNKTNKARDAT